MKESKRKLKVWNPYVFPKISAIEDTLYHSKLYWKIISLVLQ